jgi:hypothetical protein
MYKLPQFTFLMQHNWLEMMMRRHFLDGSWKLIDKSFFHRQESVIITLSSNIIITL